MPDFHDVRLPEIFEQGAQGGPTYSTSVSKTLGGREKRIANWSQPQHRWNVASPVRDEAAFHTLLAFFHARMGRGYGFRFKDWADYEAVAQPLVAVTGGYQLAKTYTSGAFTLVRKITRPVTGTVTFTGGGTLNYSTGLITGSSGGAWTGEFDIPVRFESDEFNLTLDQVDIGAAELNVLEIPE